MGWLRPTQSRRVQTASLWSTSRRHPRGAPWSPRDSPDARQRRALTCGLHGLQLLLSTHTWPPARPSLGTICRALPLLLGVHPDWWASVPSQQDAALLTLRSPPLPQYRLQCQESAGLVRGGPAAGRRRPSLTPPRVLAELTDRLCPLSQFPSPWPPSSGWKRQTPVPSRGSSVGSTALSPPSAHCRPV